MSELKITQNSLENAILKDGQIVSGYVIADDDKESNILSSSYGAFAMGYASDSSIISNGIGSFTDGVAKSNSVINANGDGAFAMGYANNRGTINASAVGAHAEGYVYNGGNIIANSSAAFVHGYVEKGYIKVDGIGSCVIGGYIANNSSIIVGENRSHNGGIAGGCVDKKSLIKLDNYAAIAYGFSSSTAMIDARGSGAVAIGCANDGENLIANGNGAVAMGYATQALVDGAHAEGRNTIASGTCSHAEGESTAAGNTYYITNASAFQNSYYSGDNNNIIYVKSIGEFCIGDTIRLAINTSLYTITNYTPSTIGASSIYLNEGLFDDAYNLNQNTRIYKVDNTKDGYATHAEGGNTIASGQYSHAEGVSTIAAGIGSHAEGSGITTEFKLKGTYTYTEEKEGYNGIQFKLTTQHSDETEEDVVNTRNHLLKIGNTYRICTITAYDQNKIYLYINKKISPAPSESDLKNIICYKSGAFGTASHVSGTHTIAIADNQTVIGQYNRPDDSALFIVGNGTSDDNRKNAYVIYPNETTTLEIHDCPNDNDDEWKEANDVNSIYYDNDASTYVAAKDDYVWYRYTNFSTPILEIKKYYPCIKIQQNNINNINVIFQSTLLNFINTIKIISCGTQTINVRKKSILADTLIGSKYETGIYTWSGAHEQSASITTYKNSTKDTIYMNIQPQYVGLIQKLSFD